MDKSQKCPPKKKTKKSGKETPHSSENDSHCEHLREEFREVGVDNQLWTEMQQKLEYSNSMVK